MKSYFLLFPIIVLFSTCNKNNTPKPDHSGMFMKFFGGAYNDAGFSVEQTSDGGFVIVGSTISEGRIDKDVYLVKTDTDGNKVWERKYGGLYDEEGLDIKIDKAGNFFVAGYVKNKKDSSDCLLLKFDKSGLLLKSFIIGLQAYNEEAKFITLDEEKNILIAGTREKSENGQKNMYMVKTNMDSVIWERELGLHGLYNDIGTVVETSDHKFLWCGTTSNGNYTDVRICLTDRYSNLYWSYVLGEGDEYSQSANEIRATQDDNYIIAGTQKDLKSNISAYLAKVSPTGELLWSKQPGGQGKSINSVYPLNDGGFVMAGISKEDYLLMKTDQEGNEIWERTYGGNGKDEAKKIIQTTDSDLLVIGTVFISNNYALGLLKTNAKGLINKN